MGLSDQVTCELEVGADLIYGHWQLYRWRETKSGIHSWLNLELKNGLKTKV